MRLSAFGRGLAVGAAALFALGVVGGLPELAYLGSVGIVALLGAAADVLRRSDVAVDGDGPRQRRISPPALPQATLRVVAPRSRIALQLVVPVDGTPHVAGPVTIVGASGRPVELRYDLPSLPRGEHELGPIRTRTSDPLELVHRERTVVEASRVLVHPRRHTMRAVPVAFDRDMDGPVPPLVVRDGQADGGLKEYETGDDLRLIHAPASRRRGTLLLRQRVVANASGLLVVLDTSVGAYATDDDFESAVSVAASVCVGSATGDRPLWLHTTAGRQLAGGRGAAVRIPALDALARVTRRAGDVGLVRLPALLGGASDRAVVVVTGAPPARQLSVVAHMTGRVMAATVVAIGWRGPLPARLAGRVVAAPDAASAAALWNRGTWR